MFPRHCGQRPFLLCRHSRLLSCGLVLAIVASGHGSPQAQVLNRAAIERIQQAPGRTFRQDTLATIALENASRATADLEAAAAAAAVPTAPPPAEPTPVPPPDDAPPAALPREGELVYVPLDRGIEREAQQAIANKVGAAVTLQTFGGALRQLAADRASVVTLKPYVLVGQPLRFQPETRLFVGSILVGVADLEQDAARALTTPLQFQVLESALVAPPTIELVETSPPYKEISVTSPVMGTTTLRVVSNFSREGIAVPIPVEPTLVVSVDGGELRAFGMQTTVVTVTAVGEPAAGRPVNFSAPGAFLENVDETFNDQGVARATLRSDKTGRIAVEASAVGYTSGRAAIDVVAPWRTLAFASVGGFVGGFIRLGSKIRRGMNVAGFSVALLISVLIGVLVFALYVVGVNVLPVTFGVQVGDLFAFAAAALAGWLGTTVLPVAKA